MHIFCSYMCILELVNSPCRDGAGMPISPLTNVHDKTHKVGKIDSYNHVCDNVKTLQFLLLLLIVQTT